MAETISYNAGIPQTPVQVPAAPVLSCTLLTSWTSGKTAPAHHYCTGKRAARATAQAQQLLSDGRQWLQVSLMAHSWHPHSVSLLTGPSCPFLTTAAQSPGGTDLGLKSDKRAVQRQQDWSLPAAARLATQRLLSTSEGTLPAPTLPGRSSSGHPSWQSPRMADEAASCVECLLSPRCSRELSSSFPPGPRGKTAAAVTDTAATCHDHADCHPSCSQAWAL